LLLSDEDFSERAEKRLELWQTKAAKAKNQIKTLAKALGQDEYSSFSRQYRLMQTELSWQLLL
jgi:Txe/YoeB family toxin of Txe-Axe toxin-antitoxin module